MHRKDLVDIHCSRCITAFKARIHVQITFRRIWLDDDVQQNWIGPRVFLITITIMYKVLPKNRDNARLWAIVCRACEWVRWKYRTRKLRDQMLGLKMYFSVLYFQPIRASCKGHRSVQGDRTGQDNARNRSFYYLRHSGSTIIGADSDCGGGFYRRQRRTQVGDNIVDSTRYCRMISICSRLFCRPWGHQSRDTITAWQVQPASEI